MAHAYETVLASFEEVAENGIRTSDAKRLAMVEMKRQMKKGTTEGEYLGRLIGLLLAVIDVNEKALKEMEA